MFAKNVRFKHTARRKGNADLLFDNAVARLKRVKKLTSKICPLNAGEFVFDYGVLREVSAVASGSNH